MRITGGIWRGRTLIAPKGLETRPTSDRVRESLFNHLSHRADTPLDNAIVLDAFAGSGALGLEALSRGASFAIFVDTSRAALNVVKRNIAALDAEPKTQTFPQDSQRLRSLASPATLAFYDPPYRKQLLERVFPLHHDNGIWAPQALLCIEHERETIPQFPFLDVERTFRFGDTQISVCRYQPDT
ncbi:MAG: 16S rRNA (guanine(966)-N(2))-methyltransferase RsmD [Pseudomonadota bacterium]